MINAVTYVVHCHCFGQGSMSSGKLRSPDKVPYESISINPRNKASKHSFTNLCGLWLVHLK